MPQSFSFIMQIYSEDVDSFGIVHHANYIKFMERARLAWLSQLGFRLDKLYAQGIFFVVKKIEVDYKASAYLYDELEIVSRVIDYRPVAKTYEQIIQNHNDPQKIYCRGRIQVVCVNKQLRPQVIPKELSESYTLR